MVDRNTESGCQIRSQLPSYPEDEVWVKFFSTYGAVRLTKSAYVCNGTPPIYQHRSGQEKTGAILQGGSKMLLL